MNVTTVSSSTVWQLYNISTEQCALGYWDSLCDKCMDGFYRLAQSCVPCPKGAWLLLFGYGFGIRTSPCTLFGCSWPRGARRF